MRLKSVDSGLFCPEIWLQIGYTALRLGVCSMEGLSIENRLSVRLSDRRKGVIEFSVFFGEFDLVLQFLDYRIAPKVEGEA